MCCTRGLLPVMAVHACHTAMAAKCSGGQTHVAINTRAGDPTTLVAACINEMRASFAAASSRANAPCVFALAGLLQLLFIPAIHGPWDERGGTQVFAKPHIFIWSV